MVESDRGRPPPTGAVDPIVQQPDDAGAKVGGARRAARTWLIHCLFALYCLVSVASFLGAHWWGFEVLSHFRPHFVIAGALLAVVLSMRPRAVPALIAGALAGIHLVPVLPYYVESPAPAARPGPGAPAGLRLAALNLRNGAADRTRVSRLLLDYRPDIVAITEVPEPPLEMFADLRDAYPHRAGSPVPGTYELLLMSRHPIQAIGWHYPAGSGLPVLEASVCPPDGCIAVIALHAIWPFARGGVDQAAMLAAVARRASARRDGRVIVIGDLNATPYSHAFTGLLRAGRLVDAARGHRRRPTWLTRVPLFGLAIDHVLLGTAFLARDARVMRGIGADHFPLLVDVAYASNRPTVELVGPLAGSPDAVPGGNFPPVGR